MTDTETVRRRFERAFHSYPQTASVQAQIADTLHQLWQQQQPNGIQRLLELGCGTGNLTRLLAQNPASQHHYLNDLCANSSQLLDLFPKNRASFLHGDMQTLPLPTQLDAIVSACAIQWVSNPIQLLQKLCTHLKPQGWLVIATFAPEHFQLFSTLTGTGLHYPTAETYRTQLAPHCHIHLLQENSHTLHFPDLRTLLHHLRDTGVTGTTPQFRWNKTRLQQLQVAYEAHRTAQGLPLNYRPLYLIARKP